MMMCRDVLMYLDRVYTSAAGVPLVYEAGLNIWRDTVVRSETAPVARRLLDVLLGLVERERSGEIIKRDAIREVTEMLVALGVDPSGGNGRLSSSSSSLSSIGGKGKQAAHGTANGSRHHDQQQQHQPTVYEVHLERPLLEQTEQYYGAESQQRISEGDAAAYLRHVDARLQQELDRAQSYLHSTTVMKLVRVVERQLLSKERCDEVMGMDGTGLASMLHGGKIEGGCCAVYLSTFILYS